MGHHLPRLILVVATGTKFETKIGYKSTYVGAYEISPRFLHLTRGFESGANK